MVVVRRGDDGVYKFDHVKENNKKEDISVSLKTSKFSSLFKKTVKFTAYVEKTGEFKTFYIKKDQLNSLPKDIRDKMVYNKKVKLDKLDRSGYTPLQSAIRSKPPHKELIEKLLDKGDGSELIALDNGGYSLLHSAISQNPPNLEIINLLINKGAPIELKDSLGNSPLHVAVSANPVDLNLINLLINKGAFLDIKDSFDNTPLHLAVLANPPNVELIELLIKRGAPLGQKNRMDQTPLEALKSTKNPDQLAVYFLSLNLVGKDGYAPLHRAISRNPPDLDAIRQLIDDGASLSVLSEKGQSPLHHALLQPNANIDVIRLLIEKGAALDLKDASGYPPLHMAILANTPNPEIIKLLIDNGANLTQLDGKNRTATYLLKAKMIDIPGIETTKYDQEYEGRALLAQSWSEVSTLPEEEMGGFTPISQAKHLELLKSFKGVESLTELIEEGYDAGFHLPKIKY